MKAFCATFCPPCWREIFFNCGLPASAADTGGKFRRSKTWHDWAYWGEKDRLAPTP